MSEPDATTQKIVHSKQALGVFDNLLYRKWRFFYLVLSIFTLLGLGFILYFGITATLGAIAKFGPAIFWKTSRLYLLETAIATLLFLLFFVRAFPPRKTRIDVHQTGFTIAHGKKIEIWEWSAIEKMRIQITRYKLLWFQIKIAHQLKLGNIEGRQLKLDDSILHIDALIQIIREKANPHLFTRAKTAFLNNQTVDFGALAVHQQNGLSKKKKTISWEMIDHIRLKDGLLSIAGHEKKLLRKLPVQNIANLDVFLALMQSQGKTVQSAK